MSARAALVNPKTLLGRELLERLQRDSGPWRELRLLTTSEEEVGDVADGLDGATFVGRADSEGLDGCEVAFLCGPIAALRPLLAALPEGTSAIVLSPDATRADGRPRVHGVSPPAERGEISVSPHPGVVALAHLLAPLRPHGLVEAVATVVQPVSIFDEPAIAAVFEETKALLTFTNKPEARIFGAQLAFNLLPVADRGELAESLREVLQGSSATPSPPIAVQVLQGGIFHGVAVSLEVRLSRTVEPAELASALTASGAVVAVDEDDRAHLGPIDTVNRDEVLLGAITPTGARPGAYWIWAVVDNLTRGGAQNALELATDMRAN